MFPFVVNSNLIAQVNTVTMSQYLTHRPVLVSERLQPKPCLRTASANLHHKFVPDSICFNNTANTSWRERSHQCKSAADFSAPPECRGAMSGWWQFRQFRTRQTDFAGILFLSCTKVLKDLINLLDCPYILPKKLDLCSEKSSTM